MTEEPQKEYIITEGMINEILNSLQGENYREVHNVLSKVRPTTTSAEVLDDLTQWLNKHTWIEQKSGIGVITKYVLMEFIRELRQQQAERERP